MAAFDDLTTTLGALGKRQLYRRRRVVETPPGREIVVGGRTLLNFCSNDYLGLAADPRVCAAFKAGVDRWGAGAGASHLVSGHTTAHEELEEALADFTGRPRTLLFGSGYAANLGTINALLGPGDHVFEDRLNHASLLDGGWISRAHFTWFGHADPADLEAQLVRCGDSSRRKLIVSDGTFSMDGDLCPLAGLVAAAHRHDAWLMIDDAHGCGVHGRGGCGVVDPAVHGIGDVPVLVGTLGKAFGTAGAFVAGSEALVETLIQRARNYIYTTALPSAVAVATLESLHIARAEEWRRDRLRELIARFRAGAAQLGLRLLPSATPIQPVIIGESGAALALSAALESRGVLVPAIRPPTVPAGTARLRVTFSAVHELADVDRLLGALEAGSVA
ncbi:MAG: 8-amino-7-oxononanoate synthase [Gammaproteobacteria bacterium]|nr:8-amino-7-oxononanoate synthase [Gammaproteobacteria bacterium]